MPRTPRVDGPGAIHHVALRGVDRMVIFRDDIDRLDFTSRLVRIIREEDSACYGWALVDNHAHLVLRSGPKGLSRVMARLETGYAMAFNARHDRVGHLLQNRFHSRLVDTDAYAHTVVRYVHLNPLEAGLVSTLDQLEEYRWSGHRELVGKGPAAIVDRAEVLSWFDKDPRQAVDLLREWMALRPAASDSSDLASRFDSIVRWACAASGLGEGRRLCESRIRPASNARALVAFLAHRDLGMAYTHIGERLSMSRVAAMKASRRGKALLGRAPVED